MKYLFSTKISFAAKTDLDKVKILFASFGEIKDFDNEIYITSFIVKIRLHSSLCHRDQDKAIVKVSGWIDNIEIGSALGEGDNAEIAEDNAIRRLTSRNDLDNVELNKKSNSTSNQEHNSPIINEELSGIAKNNPQDL